VTNFKTPAQRDVFLAPRPKTEFYHTVSELHQLQNPANSPVIPKRVCNWTNWRIGCSANLSPGILTSSLLAITDNREDAGK
jgi:hypothetical protein